MDGVAAAESLKTSIDGLVLAMVGELHATSGVKPCGWASTQDFVTATSGGHKSEGPAVVKLATVVEEPLMVPVGEAIRDGWLSTTKAQVITRAIDLLPGDPTIRARGVRFLLTEAARLDATELRKVVRHLVGVVDPDGQARRDEKELERGERAAHLDRDLVIKDDGAGGAFIRGRCSSEDATDLRTALMSLAAPVPSDGPTCDPGSCAIPGCSHNGRDPRDHGARMLDAFVELCRRARTADLLPTSHGTVPRVTVTMDFDHLRRATGYGTTETDEVLSPATIRRLACDAEIVPVILGSESQVLDIGRTSRLVTASLWTALVARDRHCRFPHCTRPPVMTHAHHIVHWADGGDTSLENLMLLCGHHHRLVHAGPWTIRRAGPRDFAFDPPPGVRRTPGGQRPHQQPPSAPMRN
ncbi:MAG: endonuclease [Marmoricola sp.]|nr:endonuclease [Marmoricola sp.]